MPSQDTFKVSRDPASTQRAQQAEYERDDLFYFDNVVFKVDNVLFRVPKNSLNVKGTPFEAMFTLPSTTTNDGHVEGSSDENPIVLVGEGVSKLNFRSFLKALYDFTGNSLTYAEVTGALRLATMWDFSELRKHLIQEASPLVKLQALHERILLARVCRVKEWLFEAYKILILEKMNTDILELANNGVDTATISKLFFIREEAGVRITANGQNQADAYCQNCGDTGRHGNCIFCGAILSRKVPSQDIVLNEIQRLFALEFTDME